MGNTDSRVNFRKAVIDLTASKKSVEPADTSFWEQFWSPTNVQSAHDVFSLIPAAEIRSLREDAPNNLATLLDCHLFDDCLQVLQGRRTTGARVRSRMHAAGRAEKGYVITRTFGHSSQ